MIGPGHSHDLAITLTQQLPLAVAAPDGERHAPCLASTTIDPEASAPKSTMSRSSGRSRAAAQPGVRTILLSLLSASPAAMAASACIPLKGSTACPAFQSASVSTDPFVVGLLYVGNLYSASIWPSTLLGAYVSMLALLPQDINPFTVRFSNSFPVQIPSISNCDPICRQATCRKSKFLRTSDGCGL